MPTEKKYNSTTSLSAADNNKPYSSINNSSKYLQNTPLRRSERVAKNKANNILETSEANMGRKKKSQSKTNPQGNLSSSTNEINTPPKLRKEENASDIRKFWTRNVQSNGPVEPILQQQESEHNEKKEKGKSHENNTINPLLLHSSKTIIIKQEWNGNIPDGVFPPDSVRKQYANKIKQDSIEEERKIEESLLLPPLENENDVNSTPDNETINHTGQVNSPTSQAKAKENELTDESKSNEEEFPVGEYDQDYDEKEILSEGEIDDLECEDDENTIDSGNTTLWGTKEELEKVRELPSVRYQFSFLLEDITISQLKEEHDQKDKNLMTILICK